MTRTCTYRGCGKSMDHLSALAKTCEDCAQEVRKDRKSKRQRELRDAHNAARLSGTARICGYPGCTNDISDRPVRTVWCMACRLTMDRSRAARRYGKEARRSVDPFARRVVNVAGGGNHPPIKCRECCDMPWARAADRSNTKSGDTAHRDPVAVNGLCRGCGLPWAPEPPIERGPGIVSSAGTAADHGRMYGGASVGSKATGRRH